MNGPDPIITGCLMAVCLLLCWLEWRRASRRNLVLRLAAILLAGLALEALRSNYSSASEASQEAILQTPGAGSESIAYGRKIYTPAAWIASGDTAIRKWFISGYGLTESELAVIRPEITGHRFVLPAAGIRSAGWSKTIAPGKPFVIQGQVFNRGKNALTLVLEAYSATQDSIRVPPGTERSFDLRSAIRHSGLAVFRLRLLDGQQVVEDNPVPVSVTAIQYIRPLVLASSPDFEYRFLQRWLGENGFPAVLRTRTSKSKYQQVFINRRSFPLGLVSSNVLDSFDVVIADADAIDALSAGELAGLKQQVSEKGLGLLLRTDTVLTGNRFYSGLFRFRNIPTGMARQTSPVLLPGMDSLPALPADQVHTLLPATGQQSIVTGRDGHILAASVLYGSGRIGISGIDNSYHWQLSGETTPYAAYWSTLLTQLARRRNTTTELADLPGVFMPGSRISLGWTGGESGPLQVVVNDSINLVAEGNEGSSPVTRTAVYWPAQKGWQKIVAGEQADHIYVYDTADWPVIQALQRIQATRTWMYHHRSEAGSTGPNSSMLHPVWWVLLLLLSLSFLWFERKFLS